MAAFVPGIQGLQLSRIPDDGGGAVGFDESDIFRSDFRTSMGIAALHTQDLTFGIGRGNGFAPAVGRGPDPVDHTEYFVVVPDGVFHALENEHHRSFPQHEPVSPLIERVGAFFRQGAHLGEPDKGFRGQVGVDPAHDHLVMFAGQKLPYTGFQGRDGRSTGRIHDIVGPLTPRCRAMREASMFKRIPCTGSYPLCSPSRCV